MVVERTLRSGKPWGLITLLERPAARTGAAVIKYGSLLISAPFQPNYPLALIMIVGPCVAYAAYLLTQQGLEEKP